MSVPDAWQFAVDGVPIVAAICVSYQGSYPCMSDQLAFAIITPYTIRKSRTGAVIARLLGRASADLVAAQMFAPSQELADAAAAQILPGANDRDEMYRQLIRSYITQNFAPARDGGRSRVMGLVFRGENAREEIARIVGHLRISCTTGETIRDTYGDLVWNDDGTVRYFEPAVITTESAGSVRDGLAPWLEHARTSPAILENVCVYDDPGAVEQTLVVIKPDSWRARSSRPGAVIDMFSRTGLRIISCKLHQMSISQALEFYGPVRDVLRRKLAPGIATRARQMLSAELDLELPESADEQLSVLVGNPYAEEQFCRIVEFMTGLRLDVVQRSRYDEPGRVKCLALVYEGVDAVQKIRDVLGPTDPTKAPGGTVRREFGSDVMVNTAHASDSVENACREIGILRMAEGNFAEIVSRVMEECEE